MLIQTTETENLITTIKLHTVQSDMVLKKMTGSDFTQNRPHIIQPD